MIEQMCARKAVCLESLHVAQDIMNSDVKTLTLDHNINQCLKFMERYKVRHVPVIDFPYEGEKQIRFIGVVSQRDVLRLSAHDAKGYITQETDKRALRQLLVQIVSVGEQTGKLDELLLNAAETLDAEADAALARFMAVLPAVLVLILAGVIGFIIAGTLLPIVAMQLTTI